MPAARKSKTRPRAKSTKSTSGLDKVINAVVKAGSSLGSMVKDNVKAAETFVTGNDRKVKSARSTRKRKAVAA